jgi:hypothetical protein
LISSILVKRRKDTVRAILDLVLMVVTVFTKSESMAPITASLAIPVVPPKSRPAGRPIRAPDCSTNHGFMQPMGVQHNRRQAVTESHAARAGYLGIFESGLSEYRGIPSLP